MTMQQPRQRDGDEANLPPRDGNHHTGQQQHQQLNGYKNNIGERIPLNSNKTNQQNHFYGGVVDKDATMPKSNLTDRYFCTSAPQQNNLQTHNNDEKDDYIHYAPPSPPPPPPPDESSSKRRRRNVVIWKEQTKNIIAISTAVVALATCIVALMTGLSHQIAQSRRDWKSEDQKQNSNIPYTTSPNLFDEVGRYIFHDYDIQTTFADFLPGLAGIYGKPLFTFYVNRGQAIASFGVESKNTPIMEFSTANTAYQNTPLVGFRTFIQGRRGDGSDSGDSDDDTNKAFVVEPFSPLTTNYPDMNHPPTNQRILYSGENELQIQEIDYENHLETNVTYFVLPEEDFGAFVRRTTISNTHPEESVTISFLDGLAKMQPAGGATVGDLLKTMGRTLEGFMGVYFPYEDIITMPFYRLSSSPLDSDFIQTQERGHYCVSMKDDPNDALLPIVYDSSRVFGQDTTLLRPVELYSKSIKDIVNGAQYGKAKTSSCFAAVEDTTLEPGESITITTYFGAADHIMDIPVIVRRLRQDGFALYKLTRTREVLRQITASVETTTGSEIFDAHVSQMFLDNSLRGGIPIVLGDEDDNNGLLTVDEDPRLKVYHVFSRIHGDLERDFNDFFLPSTFFSQGPGKFSDVAQNRRNDVVFNPKIGSFNIRMFLSFIQADGYEPHSVEAVVFTIDDRKICDEIAVKAVGSADGHRAQREALSGILNDGPFRPGQVFNLMLEQNIFLIVSTQEFIDMVAVAASSHPFAVYNEGYWADHWTYYLDIIESYLTIFPDEEERVMFDVKLPYFFSPASVQPRSKKYVKNLSYDGKHEHIQQLHATVDDQSKRDHMNKFISKNVGWYKITAHWQHDESGNIFESTIYAKLFLLVTLKFATRDAMGMGIEYEGGRPGWDDANNGIPGMLGSGMPESFELKALIQYLIRSGKKHSRDFSVPQELFHLFDSINGNLTLLEDYNDTSEALRDVPFDLFSYWDKVATARETYREQTKILFSGKTTTINSGTAAESLERWEREIDKGIDRAMLVGTKGRDDDGNSGIVPTYFSYTVSKWNNTNEHDKYGHPLVIPLNMTVSHFPLFLEGPTRMMETVSAMAARDIYLNVRNSSLYDKHLGMYTVSASLADQPIEMGRSMAFAPGWLENQSVWLHMSYKFYLQLLEHRLYDDFFDEVRNGGLLPFMDPKIYGRSLTQCSSFIASSAFEDPDVRGKGFLGRLSGSTAEFLSMWILMFIGPEPFYINKETGEIQMQLLPTLPFWLFRTHDDTLMGGMNGMEQDHIPRISFKLFSSIDVHYHNKNKTDIMGIPPKRYKVGLRDGTTFEYNQTFIPTDMAQQIRRVVLVEFIEAHF